jgi:tripartite-type tricarboxylate transporter receptor subunit TctC
VLGDPAITKRFADLGSEAMIMTPAEAGAFQKAEAEKWGKVVKTAGMKPE